MLRKKPVWNHVPGIGRNVADKNILGGPSDPSAVAGQQDRRCAGIIPFGWLLALPMILRGVKFGDFGKISGGKDTAARNPQRGRSRNIKSLRQSEFAEFAFFDIKVTGGFAG